MSSMKSASSDPDVAADSNEAKSESGAVENALSMLPVTMKATPTLLGIPRELRDMIYEYVIVGHEVVGGNLWSQDYPTVWSSSPTKWQELFSLSLVCNQVNVETKLLPYTSNIFMHPIEESSEEYYAESFLGK
ncbi:hypothetical protein NX059_003822 [Plenodomus lindquistii]|nr:hypothetical protein NX059_003822 [Plenodomus lindquistii]